MKKHARTSLFMGITLLSFLWLAGCATPSKTFLLNFNYKATDVQPFLTLADKPVTVALYQFEDVRADRSYLGRRTYPDGTVDFYKPDAGSVEQVVTKSMVKLLEKAGFKVVTVNQYLDSRKFDFRDVPGDVAIGGKIEKLWVEAKKTQYLYTDSNAKVQLVFSWGFVKDGTWISKMVEGSGEQTKHFWYQPENAEGMINEVFKDSMDKLLKDEAMLREKLLKGK